MKKTMFFWILLFLALPLYAQPKGFIDTFDGGLRFLEHPYFTFIQQPGGVRVNAGVAGGIKWQGFIYEPADPLNLSEQPLVNIKMKSDFDFLLTAYLIDAYGRHQNVNLKVEASAVYVVYTIEFSDKGISLNHIVELQFTPNGNTTDAVSGNIWIDELAAGNQAQPLASIAGLRQQVFYVNSKDNQIRFTGLHNARHLELDEEPGSITRFSFSSIDKQVASLRFDCRPNWTGSDTLKVNAVGMPGYGDNTIFVPLYVEDNNPPVIDPIEDVAIMAGDTTRIRLTGLSDGNVSVQQPLMISAHSNTPGALPDSQIVIDHQQGTTLADLVLMPIQAAEQIGVNLTLEDGGSGSNTTQTSFYVDCYQALNHSPTIDPVNDQFVYFNNSEQPILLTGIGDGDNGTQVLAFAVYSSDSTVVAPKDINIEYDQTAATARFSFRPSGTGKTDITLVLSDNGGTQENNGNAQTSTVFEIHVANPPSTGIAVDIDSFGSGEITELHQPGDWKVEGYGSTQKAETGSFYGRDRALKIEFNNKTCWTGVWYRFEELNISRHRYMCYDILLEGHSFASIGKTHSYLWDADDERNTPRAHNQRKVLASGKWHTVFMDYRGKGGMRNSDGVEINVKRINKLLINYASDFGFPFPVDNGTVYLANIRVGSAVPDTLVPGVNAVCTIDPIADQTLTSGAGLQTVVLSGISNGLDMETEISVSVVSSNESFVPQPVVGPVSADGTAELKYEPLPGSGKAVITVTVDAPDAAPYKESFSVTVVNTEAADAVDLFLDTSSQHQTINGFGTYQFSDRHHSIDLYTEDLGASAVRIGIIKNQIEPVNDNNDPDVLNLDGFNAGAFDFDYYRRLQQHGVETFILTSWSPPAWMKRNLSVGYGYAEAARYENTDNILEPYYYDEFAESMVAVVKLFRDRADIELDAIGPQNEPAFNEPYPSAVLSPEKYAELAAIIGEKFDREQINTPLSLPEQVFTQTHYSMDEYIDALAANPVADRYTGMVATHGYQEDGIGEANPTFEGWRALWNSSQSCSYSKALWMTETNPQYRNWSSAISLAGAIHGALVYGNVSLWTLWSIEGSLIDKGVPTASFYTCKNYYKFIRPGAVRIKTIDDHSDLMASAFIDTNNGFLTAVLINRGEEPLTVVVSGDSLPEPFNLYLTAENINFEQRGTYCPHQKLVLPASSVMTMVATIDSDAFSSLQNDGQSVDDFFLYQNYPNPFNPQTTIQFSVPQSLHTKIIIYNVRGRRVKVLADRFFSAGMHQIIWNGNNDLNQPVAGGLYLYKLTSEKFNDTGKCLLLK